MKINKDVIKYAEHLLSMKKYGLMCMLFRTFHEIHLLMLKIYCATLAKETSDKRDISCKRGICDPSSQNHQKVARADSKKGDSKL